MSYQKRKKVNLTILTTKKRKNVASRLGLTKDSSWEEQEILCANTDLFIHVPP